MRISKSKLLDNLPLIFILVVSAVTRAVAAFVVTGESGGDFYNYLLIAKNVLAGGTPFIEKRLPVYALMLIPGHLMGHPLGYARFLGIILALLALYFLYRLLLDLRLPKIATLTSLILLSFQPTFFLFSIRPLSHTLLDFEVILSLYIFYKLLYRFSSAQKLWFPAFGVLLTVFSIVLGLAAMTRHEGFLLAGCLLPCLFIYLTFRAYKQHFDKTSIRFLITATFYLVAPFVAIVLPWFISNYLRFGNAFYTQYQNDEGLNVARTFPELLVNLNYMRQIFLGLWGNLPTVSFRSQLLPIIVLVGWFLGGKKVSPWWLVLLIGALGLFLLIRLTGVTPIVLMSLVTVVLMIYGLVVLSLQLRLKVVPMLLVFATQFVFITLVQPWSRHSQHIFFFLAVLLALGIYAAFKLWPRRRLFSFLLIIPVVVFLAGADVKEVKDYQLGSQLSWPLVTSAKYLQATTTSGLVLVHEPSAEASYYLGNRLTTDLEEALKAKYFIDYNDNYLVYLYNLDQIKVLASYETDCVREGYNICWAKVYEVL